MVEATAPDEGDLPDSTVVIEVATIDVGLLHERLTELVVSSRRDLLV
jgi:hypothetical protein